MASTNKEGVRERRAKAYRDLARDLSGIASAIYKPTSSSIFASLSSAHLNEQNAASSQLSRQLLFGENPEAAVPDELSDKTISQYLANAGDFYGGAATDYVVISDLQRAYKYFRMAAQQCRRAAELQAEDGSALLEKARKYQDKTAIVRQEIARRAILRRKWSLGLLSRPK